MKHLMHQDTKILKLIYWENLPVYTYFHFLNEYTIYRTTSLKDRKLFYDVEDGYIYDTDSRPAIEVKLFRVHRRKSIYKDKVIKNAEDEKTD